MINVIKFYFSILCEPKHSIFFILFFAICPIMPVVQLVVVPFVSLGHDKARCTSACVLIIHLLWICQSLNIDQLNGSLMYVVFFKLDLKQTLGYSLWRETPIVIDNVPVIFSMVTSMCVFKFFWESLLCCSDYFSNGAVLYLAIEVNESLFIVNISIK